MATAVMVALVALVAAVIVVVTDRGRLEIISEVGDVEVQVSDGDQVTTIDAKTGSQVKWLPTGDYQVNLKGTDNDIKLDKSGFQMSRLGKVLLTARWNTAALNPLKAFAPTDEPITGDGVSADDGGWKIAAMQPRSVRLFEVKDPGLAKGPFFYRARLKTQNLEGKAYLEMWVRLPGQGEFFSKGFHNAVSGTNGWAEYEIPFFLEAGQQPDLVKLNLAIEGSGTVWIKDIELRGRPAPGIADQQRLQGKWVATAVKAGNGVIPASEVPKWTMTFNVWHVQVTTPTMNEGGEFKLDPIKDPREIDVEPASGEGRLRGIYRFVGDELEICMDDSNRKRPIQWDVDAGTKQLLVRLRHLTADGPD